jgi:ATP-dependent Clp protease ATP-binding subunit ClpB
MPQIAEYFIYTIARKTEMLDSLTKRAQAVVGLARDLAVRTGAAQITPEHLLWGLVTEGKGLIARVLGNWHLTCEGVRSEIEALTSRGDPTIGAVAGSELHFSSAAIRVLDLAVAEARSSGSRTVGTENLLIALLSLESPASALLSRAGMHADAARELIIQFVGETDPL